jgi:hypothetical protein
MGFDDFVAAAAKEGRALHTTSDDAIDAIQREGDSK